jgi:purine-binding chemotaxis protein CheW
MDILPFEVADRAGAIALETVRRVLRATEILPLPRTPRIVEGIIDFHGEIVPVIDLRERFGLARKALDLSDRFIIADAGGLLVGLHVDSVGTASSVEPKQVGTGGGKSLSESLGIAGAASLPDGMLLIHDLDSFFTAAEREAISSALAERT